VARLTEEAKPPRTPLQTAMGELSRSLVLAAIGVSLLVPMLGIALGDRPVRDMVLVGLALAFATIPEELPIIVTMVLALGGYRLSRRRAIAKRLQAVETLGAVTLIATDKTGTLTENRMRVVATEPEDFAYRILEIAALATDPVTSDPMQRALLESAAAAGIDVAHGHAGVLAEYPFDERRFSSAVAAGDREVRVAAVGAPEAVLERCTQRWTVRGARELTPEALAEIAAAVDRMAQEGLRVLGTAERISQAPGPPEREEAEADLVFAGLVGLADPPRPEVPRAVEACRAAGIHVVMVTGDHPQTAAAVARAVGLGGTRSVMTGEELRTMSGDAVADALEHTSVFARIDPADKLRIVEAARSRGDVIAVTGDGVNDAPALATADVGVAMGRSGTDVAREAADVVLADDDFATIVHAIGEGRVLFTNLRKGVRYYLACKAALVGAVLVPAILGIPLPFAPVQIILMELFMDLAASAAFVAEPGEEDLMWRPPRDRRRPFVDRAFVASVLRAAAGLFAAVTAAYLVIHEADPAAARTAAFATWLLGHFLLALNMRSEREPLLRLGPFGNRLMIAWGAVALVFVTAAVLVPALHDPLRTVALSPAQWAISVGAAIAGTCWLEGWKWLTYGRS
jgi:Ca2+-transporting ATPase